MDDRGDERTVGLRVEGTDGDLEVVNPLAPQLGNVLILTTADGEERETVERTSSYSHQLRAFRDAVDDGAPVPTGGRDAVATMRPIDAIYEKAGLAPRPSAP